MYYFYLFFFFQAEDGIRDLIVTGVQTCALPISGPLPARRPNRMGDGEGRRARGAQEAGLRRHVQIQDLPVRVIQRQEVPRVLGGHQGGGTGFRGPRRGSQKGDSLPVAAEALLLRVRW